MTFRNDKKELRKGEKLLVMVEEVCHNTILVTLEYRKAKFSGVLLNTTNRRGPYGIEEQPIDSYYKSYGIDPAKLKAEDQSEVAKARRVPPPRFPQAIDTRTTYAQKIDHPPERQIFQRRRRSKRKVRMDMMDTDLALKIMNANCNRKLLCHLPTCSCGSCSTVDKGSKAFLNDKPLKSKRVLMPTFKKIDQKRKFNEERSEKMKHLSNGSKRIKLDKKVAIKSQDENSDADNLLGMKRSPAIKISYKSPGGKGRVLKIPSRIHSPPKDSQKNALHERARKAVMRAKNERFKHVKDHKGSSKSNAQNVKATITTTVKGKKNTVSTKLQKTTKCLKNQNLKKDSNIKPVSELKPNDIGSLFSRNKIEVSEDVVPLKRKSSSPHKITPSSATLSVPESSTTPPKKKAFEFSAEREKKPKLEPRRDHVNSVMESPNTQEKRQLRTAPQVLLQPLKSEKRDEWCEGSPVTTALPGVKGHHAAAKLLHDMSDDDISIASTSSASGKKRDTSLGASHSLTVTRCTTKDGVQWCQGDVVWAKIMGFPWWPGVLRKIVVKKDVNSTEQIAIVDWFRSKTVSHIPCSALESFSGNFKKRYNKKVKGNYKKAIEDAREAEKKMSPEVRKLIVQFETT